VSLTLNSNLLTKKRLITNKLSLNIAKTEFMTIGSRQRINATQGSITIKLDGSEINKVDTVKSSGVHIDKHLSWSTHIEKLTKKIASAIGALKCIRPFVSTRTAVQVYQALIQPHLTTAARSGTVLGKLSVIKYRDYRTKQ
jgi:hypothetical protein